MEKRRCKCHICRIEQELTISLQNPAAEQSFRILSDSFQILGAFRCALDLIEHLHRRSPDTKQADSTDRILSCLVRAYSAGLHEDILSGLLGLAFVPTLHKTFHEIRVSFALSLDDLAQQVFVDLFQTARSPSVQNRTRHVSAAVARLVHTRVLRWALKQTLYLQNLEPLASIDPEAQELTTTGNIETSLVLHDFLDRCVRDPTTPRQNLEIFIEHKLKGFTAKEMAKLRGNLSPKAIHRKVEKAISLLRSNGSKGPHYRDISARRQL